MKMKSKTVKWCNGCRRDLPRTVASFGSNRARPDGLNAQCKLCCAELPRRRLLLERSSLRAVADAEILTAEQFWASWEELLEVFAVDDTAYVSQHGRLFETDSRHLTSSDGRSARMENA
jgi:hypothetical protein